MAFALPGSSLLLNDKSIKTNAEAQTLVEQTIAQFLRGKWQRYYDPESDVLLTGRSSLLNENDQFARFPRTQEKSCRTEQTFDRERP